MTFSSPHNMRVRFERHKLLLSCVFLLFSLLWITSSADAATLPPEANLPVLLEADSVHYDQDKGIAKATGNVEVMQGDRILNADELFYETKKNLVTARGNVSLLEKDGNVIFANEVVLKDDLKQGVITNIRARLADNSLFAASSAERKNENVTEFHNAVYSPCKVCKGKNGKDKAPLWQIKAKDVVYDKGKQRISYNDAWFEVYGVPVAYMPYMSHVTPDADRKSGLLAPSYSVSTSLGTAVEVPYYVNIAPQMDATLRPTFTSKEGTVLKGDFRHLTETGKYTIKGSITNPEERDDITGALIPGQRDIRGHIQANGAFRLDPTWSWGFDAFRTTDDTYLRRYEISNEDTLTSQLYLEGIGSGKNDRSYARAQTLSFQGLNEEDDPDTTPLVLPLVNVEHQTQKLWAGSRMKFTGNALGLHRGTGPETKRISTTAAWDLPWRTRGGHLFGVNASMRADGYMIENIPLAGGNEEDTNAGRAIPELNLSWRYPLAGELGQLPLTIEPIAEVILAPHGGNPDEIPNDDSLAIEFADSNLFSNNRYAGLDRVESGPRANYGVRSSVQLPENRFVSILLGQSYRLQPDRVLALGPDPDDLFSDYVGNFAYTDDLVFLQYRFRLREDDLSARSHALNTELNLDPVVLSLDYIFLRDDPTLTDREEVFAAASYNFHENWTLTAGGRRDLSDNGGMVDGRAGLIFHNECITVLTNVSREFTQYRDIEPSTSFLMQLSLKNLN